MNGIVNLVIFLDEFSPLRDFLGSFLLLHERKKTEKMLLVPPFREEYTRQCIKLTIPKKETIKMGKPNVGFLEDIYATSRYCQWQNQYE